ncbi:MAG: TrmH family RNA methyltransferase [Bacteroidota bacterium]
MRKLSTRELQRLSVEDFRREAKTPVVLILDNIRSGLNVGSAFRTADAFLLEQICLCGITAQPPHREILKTAIGATDSVAWQHYTDTTAAINTWRKRGYTILAIEQAEGSQPLQDYPVAPTGRYALVFGNEVKGVADEVMATVDGALEIPQYGTKHSLNISVCVGLVVWEFFRRMKL